MSTSISQWGFFVKDRRRMVIMFEEAAKDFHLFSRRIVDTETRLTEICRRADESETDLLPECDDDDRPS